MKTITDDDLVLLYYGEHDDAALAQQVARDPELSRRFEALCRDLSQLDELTVPDPGPDLGARMWQRMVPELAGGETTPARESWLQRLLRPRFSLAGLAMLVLVASMSFLAGRQAEPSLGLDAQRLLEARISEHLVETEILLTHVANGGSTGARESELAADLLLSNRIYRRAAATSGQGAIADLLNAVERPLLQLANDPDLGVSIDDSLLFQVRARSRRDTRHPNETNSSQEI
ncbi:MAG: hypothetical protein AAGE01_10690 [Pseudomonadota bacterium]